MKGRKGRVAIVTGGANGIGAGLVGALAAAGARVVSGDVNEEAGAAVARQAGGEAHFRRTDLRDDADIERLVALAVEKFGGVDFLICAACTYGDGGMDAARGAWQTGFDVNLFGHMVLMQKALP